jgi:hypothetical protein
MDDVLRAQAAGSHLIGVVNGVDSRHPKKQIKIKGMAGD